MVFSIRTKTEKGQQLVNCQEAYNLFDILSTKYLIIEQTQIGENFAHDPTLKIALKEYNQAMKKESVDIEIMMDKYGIKGIDSPRKGVHTSINTEILTDEFIGQRAFMQVQENIEMYLRAIRTSTTNDNVRELFLNQFVAETKRMDSLLKFVKLKGWINQPPLYPNVAPDTPERIDSGEAYHLWDHLTFRYDNIEQTQIFYEVAHDGDLKLLIKQGLQDTLKEQAAMLEKEVLYFGIPMPKAHAKLVISIENTEIVDDDYIYRTMLIGMQGASIMHAQAYKQCVTNDRIRKIFKQLLLEEVNLINKLIQYGKLKGWINVPPHYKL